MSKKRTGLPRRDTSIQLPLHSPGKWTATKDGIVKIGGETAFCPHPPFIGSTDEERARADREYKYNARLIAAAPEMLEFLKAIFDPDGEHLRAVGYDDCNAWYSHARSLIDRAQGGNGKGWAKAKWETRKVMELRKARMK